MTEVYFFTEVEKLLSALDILGIEDFRGARVPIKLHMGEPGNRYYISPSMVKLTAYRLKDIGAEPFLFDTTVAYPGLRALTISLSNRLNWASHSSLSCFKSSDICCICSSG